MKRTYTLLLFAVATTLAFATPAYADLVKAQNCAWEIFVYEENGAVQYDRLECDTADGNRSVAAIRQKMYYGPPCQLYTVDPNFTLTGSCQNPVAWVSGEIACLQPDVIYGDLTAAELFVQNSQIYDHCGVNCGYSATVLEQGSLFEVKCNNSGMLN